MCIRDRGNIIELALGYTHNIFIQLPAEGKVEAKSERNKNPLIILESCDKQLLGQVCSKIRSFRKPEQYKLSLIHIWMCLELIRVRLLFLLVLKNLLKVLLILSK